MKVVYHNFSTNEVIEDKLPETSTWLEMQFYHMYIQLEDEEISFYGDREWRLISYIPPDVLKFEFNTDDYTY